MLRKRSHKKRQVDEVQGKVNVLKEQMKSVRTQDAIVNEAKSIDVQIAKLTIKSRKSKITNPIKERF
jgi:HlyD family secretion protein